MKLHRLLSSGTYLLSLLIFTIISLFTSNTFAVDVPLYHPDYMKSFDVRDRIDFDYKKEIFKDREGVAFLTKLSQELARSKANSSEGYYYEQRSRERLFTPGQNRSASWTTCTLESGKGKAFAERQYYKIMKTDALLSGETNMFIVTARSGDTITVVPMFAGKVLTAVVAATDKFMYVGTVFPQGSDKSTPLTVKPNKESYQTQIFKNSYALTRTSSQERMIGETERSRMRMECEGDHSEDMEWAILMNREKKPADDTNEYTGAFEGLPHRILDKSPNVFIETGGTAPGYVGHTYTKLKKFANALFVPRRVQGNKYQHRLAICNGGGIDFFNELNEDKSVIIDPNVKIYGVPNVVRVRIGKGTWDLFEHPVLTDVAPDNEKPLYIPIHTRFIEMRMLQDTIFQANIQLPGLDGTHDQLLTEGSFFAALPEMHGIYGDKEDIAKIWG